MIGPMTKQRRRKGRTGRVEQGMGGLFADVAALPPSSDASRGVPLTPAIPADLDRYRRHVAHLDMPEDRKADLLRAVWTMMGSFVDRAFGDDPVQHCRIDVGKSAVNGEAALQPVIDCADDPATPDNDLPATFRHATEKRGARKR